MFNGVLFVSIVSTMLLSGYWLLLDYKLNPIDELLTPTYLSLVSGGPEVMEVEAGKPTYVNWHLDIKRECLSEFTRTFINMENLTVIALESHRGIQPGELGPVKFSSRLDIPYDLLPGQYEYRIKGTFDCNPLQEYVKKYPPILFRVTPNGDSQ